MVNNFSVPSGGKAGTTTTLKTFLNYPADQVWLSKCHFDYNPRQKFDLLNDNGKYPNFAAPATLLPGESDQGQNGVSQWHDACHKISRLSVRDMLVARPHCSLLCVDYNQLEVLAITVLVKMNSMHWHPEANNTAD